MSLTILLALIASLSTLLSLYLLHALRQSQTRERCSTERLARLGESLQEQLLIVDRLGTIVATAGGGDSNGFYRMPKTGQPLAQFDPELSAALVESHSAALASGVGSTTLITTGSDGNRREVRITISPLPGGDESLILIRDTTREADGELALEESRRLVDATFDQGAMGIALLDLNGCWLESNRKLGKILGYSSDELAGNPVDQIIDADDINTYRTLVARLIAGEPVSQTLELRLVGHGGRAIDANLTTTVVRNREGEASRLILIVDEITRRKEHERQLELLARRAEALLELPLASEQLDETSFMQRGQELAEDLTGSSIAFIHFVNEDEQSIELVTWSRRTLHHYCHAAYDTHYPVSSAGIWAEALRQRRAVTFNDYATCEGKRGLPDGHAALTRLISVPVIENDRVVMLTGVGNKECDYDDIDVETVQLISNEIWRIVQRRRQAEQIRVLAQAIEQSPESVVITDIDANIEYVNAAFEKTSGYSRDDAIGNNPRILNSGNTPAKRYEEMWTALSSGQPWSGEFINRTRSGEEYIEFARIVPLREADGSIAKYVAVKEDITSKKQMEMELDSYRCHLETVVAERTNDLIIAREQAEEASRAKSAFLANMSHEIRTPMNAIIGQAYLLQREIQDSSQHSRLNKIQTAADHLLAIINNILDLSKIEAGKMELERSDFKPLLLLEQVRSLLADEAASKQLTLVVEHENAPEWVRGDITRLRQALLNYGSNAIKFSLQGTIRIRLSGKQEGDTVLMRFEVDDEGEGIPQEVLGSLFERFAQGDPSTTRRHGGTGLGLAITSRLAAMMGGDAGASRKESGGSIFWFTARLEPGSPTPGSDQSTRPDDYETSVSTIHHGARVLVVEDNEINREVAVDLLRDAGLTVDSANNGLEAVERVRSTDYGVVLMDVQMPEMDGLEATRSIRAIPGMASLPILAMTANIFQEDRDACLAAGMDDFVAKPVEPENLFAKISHWLGGNARAEGVTVTSYHRQEAAASPPSASGHDADEIRALELMFGMIPGFNWAAGAARCGNDLYCFRQRLIDFGSAHRHDIDHTLELHRAGNQTDAALIADGLARDASLLGLERLATTAEELAGWLRSHHPAVNELPVDNLHHQLQQLDLLIDGLDEEPATAVHATASPLPAGERTGAEGLKTADMESCILDHNILARMFDPASDRAGEFINRFLTQAKNSESEIASIRRSRDQNRIGFIAHKLKSSARTIGAIDYADHCQALEVACRSGEWQAIDQLCNELPARLNALHAAVASSANSGTEN